MVPSYIASLPVRPSQPTFVLPKPTPNLKGNPTKNYCGYGWESAQSECFHACPSGKDDECPGGRACHSWMTCTPKRIDPATYNVCGKNWSHASSSCSTRCFLGGDDVCPPGQTCFGGVADCGDDLPELTAEDVGLAEKSYTKEEIAILLDEEIERERDEARMEDPQNWWCGSSWSDMLTSCSRRCTSDDDCKPNAWTEGVCFRTTGGPDNCSTPGVPVKEALPPGSMWCGSSWNNMLETCDKKCSEDEDCGYGRKCWEAPDTCQYVGVPVKEATDPGSLWCGTNFGDAMTSCVKACPGEGDDECPDGMSCFAGSECTEEGEPIVREGYRCGVSWADASEGCNPECQSDDDCEMDEMCFSEVVCKSEMQDDSSSGMFCGVTWESTGMSCAERCEEDEDCPNGQWCYWVDCGEDSDDEDSDRESSMKEPTTEATQASCNAEVRRCPGGKFVGRAAQLGCDFYPCPEEEKEEEDGDDGDNGGGDEAGAEEGGGGGGGGGDSLQEQQQAMMMSASAAASLETDPLSRWGTAPLAHACSSDSSQSCDLCQGDCNSDDDCRPGLMCFSRGRGEMTSVPGCVSGGEGDKPGMDYCYTPFPPATTTTTTTTSTTTTSTTTATTAAAMMVTSVGDLEFKRECTASRPCRTCEGDCDNETHCAGFLRCYSRGVGSVDPVPGCLGLGIPGMDYCYDPNASIIAPPTAEPTPGPKGCSAEVRVCPDGRTIVYRDPRIDCDFATCPVMAKTVPLNAAATKLPPPPPTRRPTPPPVPTTSHPTFDASTFFCGYDLDEVNRNCDRARPCPLGSDSECPGLQVCVRDTDCGVVDLGAIMSANAVAAMTSPPPTTKADACDDLCLSILPPEFCPMNLDLPPCTDVGIGEVCEADGECATDDALNNCGTYDIYARVRCGFDGSVSQGEIMRGTASPTARPSDGPTSRPTGAPVTGMPTEGPTTARPTTMSPTRTTPVPTVRASVSIADAIANAQSSASSSSSSVEPPTPPPIREYESSAAIMYDRSPGGGGGGGGGSTTYDRNPGKGGGAVDEEWEEEAVIPTAAMSAMGGTANEDERGPPYGANGQGMTPEVGSGDWYGSVYGETTADNDAESMSDEGGWNFDGYFTRPATRNSALALNMNASLVLLIAAVVTSLLSF